MTPTGSGTPPWAAMDASPGLSEIVRSVGERASGETRSLLEGMDDAEVANVLEATPPRVRGILWGFLDPGRVGGVLNSLDDEVRGALAEAMDARELAAAADSLDTDDLADVIIEDADETLLAQAGLETDEETFTPVLRSARRRAIWLGVNLITAFLAAAVINVFEETIAEVVALAVLMPIVASMGGIAGTQTLTLVIRGMALGQIAPANLGWFLNRELLIAALNGLLWAALVATGAALAFQDVTLGGIIALAMVINILVAAIAGSLLPSLLAMLDVDPAIAGGIVLTTVTDVAGFFTFLGLATLVYS